MSKEQGVSLDELVKILKQEEADASSFHGSDLAAEQAKALNAFYGKPYGDEIEGRSKAVVRDVQDTVQWIMPDLLRPFRSPDELLDVTATSPQDDAPTENGKSRVDISAAYLAHVAFKDNPGLQIIHDFAFDGLVQRVGWICVSWETPKPKPPRVIEGVGPELLEQYVSDPAYEIMGQEESGEGVFTLQVKHTPKMGRVHLECAPPEEMAFKKGTRSMREGHYCRRKRRKFLAEVISEFPDHAETLKQRKPSAEGELSSDGRASAREGNGVAGDPINTAGREECDLIEEFIRIDFDGDGIVELRRVQRVDDVILFNEAVEWVEFVPWTPYRVSHKIDGLSVHDVIGELQKIRSVITRYYLDGLGRVLTPTRGVNMNMIDVEQGTLAALQSNDVGGIVPVRGDIRQAVQDLMTPDVSAPAMAGLEHFDRRIAESTGVTKQAQGMDPQAMNKTATGIDLLQAAAKTRIEMVATWLGLALEEVFSLVLKQLAAHQDGARQVKLFGKWTQVDPRSWSDEAAVSVHVGTAGVSRHQRIGNLNLIAQKQEQIMMTAGPGNPLVTLQHYRTTLAQLATAMGFKDTTAFFGEVPEDWQPPEPPPDPKAQADQAKLQLEQAKAQQAQQIEQQRMQFDQQRMTAEFQHKTALEKLKLDSDREVAQMRLASERDLAVQRMQFEQEMARERMKMESDMAARQQSHREEQDKIKGFRPGGQLDA